MSLVEMQHQGGIVSCYLKAPILSNCSILPAHDELAACEGAILVSHYASLMCQRLR